MNNHVLQKRNTGIDQLKVIAILMIILFHSVQTLSVQSGVSNLSSASKSFQQFVLSVFYTFGVLGNNTFFVCSAWFLLDSGTINTKRVFRLLIEIWFFSMSILIIAFLIRSSKLKDQNIVSFLFPTFFGNNWYMTCYLLFYIAHQGLNDVIRACSKKRLFNIAFILAFLYMGMSFLDYGHLYVSQLIVWIAMYFVIAYVKLYCSNFCNSLRMNTIALLIGVCGHVGLMIITNILGLRISFLKDFVLKWDSYSSPLMFIIAFSLLNLFRLAGEKRTQPQKIVVFLSGLSMYIYLFHENLILRRYRTNMFQYLFAEFGMSHLLFYVFVVAVFVFGVSVLVCSFYHYALKRKIQSLSDRIYDSMRSFYNKATMFV